MDWKAILMAAACVLAAAGCSRAKEPAAAAAPGKAKPDAAAKAPASGTAAVATVGTSQITRGQVDAPLKNAPPGFPPERLAAVRQRVLGDMIVAQLMHAYVTARKAPCDANELSQLKGKLASVAAERKMTPAQLMKVAGLTEERLADQIRLKALGEEVAGTEKVDAFIQSHPACFNGTKVQASHILIACKPHAATTDQKAAVAKLTKLAADIQAGTTTFAKAAGDHSTCPSGKKGGDLGEFAFESMVPPFALKAFEMKVGEMSGVVRTQFGFHLIQVTKRTEGKAAPGTGAHQLAEKILLAQLQNRILAQALTTCPIVINK